MKPAKMKFKQRTVVNKKANLTILPEVFTYDEKRVDDKSNVVLMTKKQFEKKYRKKYLKFTDNFFISL